MAGKESKDDMDLHEGETQDWDQSAKPSTRSADQPHGDMPDFDSSYVSFSEFDVEADEEPLPEAVGPYRIVRVLGEGGMGMVCLAEQTEPVRRQVAVKLVKGGAGTREIMVRFRAEQQALAMMSHPNIASVFDAGASADGRPFFVMEYVPGVPITQYCDEQRLDTEERLELFLQLCDALQHAHHKGIIHRDIKPSNALVMSPDGKPIPKIIDFGIAKAMGQELTENTLFTGEGVIIGTPDYMSPEQAAGDPDIDTRTDIYSLGVLLYELLAGALPFDPEELRSGGFVGIQRMILEREPVKPSTRLRGLDRETSSHVTLARKADLNTLFRRIRGDLDWIILRCLEKDRARRYSSASELRADVLRHLQHEPVLAGPPGLAYRARKFARKHRDPLAVAVVFLLVLAGLAAVALHVSTRRFRTNLENVRQALLSEDLDGARKILANLESSHKRHSDVMALAEHVEELDRDLRIRESQRLQKEGELYWRKCLDLSMDRSEEEHKAKRAAHETLESWRPYWERDEELQPRHRLDMIDEAFHAHYDKAILAFSGALEAAPPGSGQYRSVQRSLEKVYWKRYHEAWQKGFVTVPASFFKNMVDSLGLGTFAGSLSETVFFSSEPPGAEIYCFRYENREERLCPIPFKPSSGIDEPRNGLLGDTFLEVERVWVDGSSPFRAGDRIVKIRGKALHLRSQLAHVLSGVGEDEALEVEILREGQKKLVSWVPFPAAKYRDSVPLDPRRPGRLVDMYNQFDFTLSAYPLEFAGDCRVGRTGADDPVNVSLPRGSYLFVLRKEGYADVRYPVSVPLAKNAPFRKLVKLLREDKIPPGFIYVPGGAFPYGGDSEAYNGLDEDAQHVGSFLMARCEVTLGEYLKFLNDPEISRRIQENGHAPPFADWNSEELVHFAPPAGEEEERTVRLVPIAWQGRELVVPDNGRWRLTVPEDWPVVGIPMLAGVEYALWLTRKHGGPWRFRLPRDLEWEKAARGADGRIFVWGAHLFWSFCRSFRASYPGRPHPYLDRVGTSPFDESVFGIRDLAGSLKEPVMYVNPRRLHIVRGGEWQTEDHRDFRVATRNRKRPEYSYQFVGLRLAADLVPQESE